METIPIKDVTDERTILNIEKFFSPQGEGVYCGVATVWLRTWGCTNRCRGFGASNPIDPSTYDDFTEQYDPKEAGATSVTDLPVFRTGCDSRHTWDKRYRHLAAKETVSEIADQLTELMKSDFNPDGRFENPWSETHNHLAITGGEPMMHQQGIIDLFWEFDSRLNRPQFITIETNCTVPLTENMKSFLMTCNRLGVEVLFSMSPKLETVSGDDPKIAHKINVVDEYAEYGQRSYLKIVCRGEDRVWDELESRMEEYISMRSWEHIEDVWIMPVGSDAEGQSITAGEVANKAAARGYRVCPRAHIAWFGNKHCT